MHSCSQKICAVFVMNELVKSKHCFLHSVLKFDGRGEGRVWFYFHDVELKFLAETEFGHFDEVDDAAVKVFEHFVGYG